MKRISIFLLLILLLSSVTSYAQDGPPHTNLRIVPASPNASALGTFGVIPTNNYVGQANLSIPIYEIDLDGKKFPITLSYHTDGTRVAQEATWVGLGWTLQAGGCIIKQVQGKDDFASRGNYTNYDAPWLADPTFQVTNQNLEKYMGYFNGDYDAEPDIFYFSAGSHSGTMFFDVVKNNRQQNAVPTIQTKEQVVKMTYDTYQKRWTMIDLEGYVYTFSTKESTYSYLASDKFYNGNFPRSSISVYDREPEVVTAWMLDSVTSPTGRKIVFNYKREIIYTPVIVAEDAIFLSSIINGIITAVSPSYFTSSYNYTFSCSKVEQCILSGITFEGGKVEFETTNREDIESAESGKKIQKLSGIKVTDTAGNFIKKTSLEHKYLSSGTESTTAGYNDRLLLSKIYDIAGAKRANEYTFAYNMGQLPAKNSPSVDAWGFYNGASPAPTSQLLRISPNIFWSESIIAGEKTSLFLEGMNRSFNEDLCKIGTLSNVTYPTGGSTTFEYEGHRFDELPLMPPLRETTIASVENDMQPAISAPSYECYLSAPFVVDDSNPKIIMRKRHNEPHPSEYLPVPILYSTWVEKKEGDQYKILFSSPDTNVSGPWLDDVEHTLGKGTYRVGLKVSKIGHELEYPISIWVEIIGKGIVATSKDYLGAGLRVKSMMNTDGNGNQNWRKFEYLDAKLMVKPTFSAPVRVQQTGSWAGNWMDAFYMLIQSTPYVPLTSLSRGNLVGYSAVNESYGDMTTQGYITYRYYNAPDEIPEIYLAGTPTIPDFKNGKLSAIDYCDKNRKLLKREDYTYSATPLEKVWAPKIRTYYFSNDYTHPTRSMQPYKLTAQSFYLNKKVTTEYHPEGNIIDEERYEYNNYGMITSLKSNKHGVEKESQFKYAGNYTDAIANKMKEKYMMGIQIERIDLSGSRVINASKTEFKDTLNMILPKRTLKFNSSSSKTLSDYASAYVQDIWFDKYTSKGRLLGYIRNNLPVSFLWAYNHLYPVAKIEGKTYGAVEKISPTNISQLPANMNTTSIASILNTVCDGLKADNALVTTYLYRPLIGVTEIINPNKQKTSYEYDEFNRLWQTKDHNGKVADEYKYNYKH